MQVPVFRASCTSNGAQDKQEQVTVCAVPQCEVQRQHCHCKPLFLLPVGKVFPHLELNLCSFPPRLALKEPCDGSPLIFTCFCSPWCCCDPHKGNLCWPLL